MSNCRYQVNETYRYSQAFLDFAENLELMFDREGEMLFSGSRNTIKRFTIGQDGDKMDVVVKRFNMHNVFQKIAYSFFVPSKAKRAFENGMELLRIGCGTPSPIAYAEIRSGVWLQRCYYVTVYTDDESVRQALEVDFNRPLAKAFALFVARLHEHAVVHHDLNFSNVLYRQEGGENIISVIDINRMTIKRSGRLALEECKDDFVRWTDRKDLFEYVMREYAKARGLDEDAFFATAAQMKRTHDKAWRRRKKFTAALKRIIQTK